MEELLSANENTRDCWSCSKEINLAIMKLERDSKGR